MNESTGQALILHTESFGERDTLLTLFCTQTGKRRGLVKGRKQAATLQPMDIVRYTHFRRLEGQLGTFTVERETSRAFLWMENPEGPLAIGWLAELLSRTLPEEHAFPGLAGHLSHMFPPQTEEWPPSWQQTAKTERLLLHELGYTLELADSPVRENAQDTSPLMYVSPKTGRAVSHIMGKPYASQLLILPHLWGGEPQDTATDIQHTYKLLTHFLTPTTHGPNLEARPRWWQKFTP